VRLLQDQDVDVVYIVTPHSSHYAVAKAALEAGKHVLCEKPMTINAREASSLLRLAREKACSSSSLPSAGQSIHDPEQPMAMAGCSTLEEPAHVYGRRPHWSGPIPLRIAQCSRKAP
jgi:hypothetical protein